MPPSKRLRCDDPEWTQRKAAIEEMYVFDRLSQKKIRAKLEEDGFRVTKSELEAQLRFWNIRKNASADAWRYTDYKLLKREKQGKDSVVYYNGRKITQNTLKKERSRYQSDTLTKCMTTISPKTPEGMELCIRTPTPEGMEFCIRTPTPTPFQSMWARTLPWVRFLNKVLPSMPLHLTNQIIDDELPQAQLDFSPVHRQLNGDPFRNASELAVNVASMMPKKGDNEIVNSAQIIVQGATDQAFDEHIQVILYCLSNNIYEIDDEDKLSWLKVVDRIERSGLTNQPLKLAQEKDSTVKSIAENLFRLCIEFTHWFRAHASNSKMISWLLESGQNPDVEVRILTTVISPLQVATKACDCELAMELLDAGADPKQYLAPYHPPLVNLLRDDRGLYLEMTSEQRDVFRSLVQRLLDGGASLNEGPSDKGPSALMWAVRLDLQIADMFIHHGAKVEYQVTQAAYTGMIGSEFIRTQSVIGFAMHDIDEEQAIRKVQHIIGHLQRSGSSIPVADLINADVICLAACYGFKEVIGYCCDSRNDTNTRKHALFSALCAASCMGDLETCELLLQHGAPIRGPDRLEAIPSPTHFAALMDHFTVIELLCEHGADVNVEFKANLGLDHARNYMWNRVITSLDYDCWLKRWYDMQSVLDFNRLYINPLGAAIIGADGQIPQSFETLIQFGANLPVWAAYYGAITPQHPGIVSFAVEQGGNLNWRGSDGRTPLQRALQPFSINTGAGALGFDKTDCLAVINSLVAAGAETAGSEAELIVLLRHWAHPDEVAIRAPRNDSQLKECNLSILAAILLTRSIPRINRVLATCLGAYDPSALCASVMLAISSSSMGPVQQLIINRPESVNGTEQEGVALGLAAWHNREDILDVLLSKIQSSTPALVPLYLHDLTWSARHLAYGFLQSNISKSFAEEIPFWYREPEGEDEWKLPRGSPLVFSIWSQRCLDKLLKHNFCLDRLTISVAVCHGDVEVLQKLIHGKRVDDSHEELPGPVYLSVKRGSKQMTQILLKAGFNPNEPNDLVRFGRSPLQKAVEDGNFEAIDLLLEARADVNAPAAKAGGATALQLAAITGRLGIAKRLVDLGANVNAPGAEEYGRTALEGAAEHGSLDMVQFLLDCGANVIGDGCLHYFRAISFAREERHIVVANYLRNHREWTSFEHEMFKLFTALDKYRWKYVKELNRSSMEQLIARYTEACVPEETASLDIHSSNESKPDDESIGSQNESLDEGGVGLKEVECVGSAHGIIQNSWEGMSAGTGHHNAIADDHISPRIYNDTTWNQQIGNPEGGIQTSWEDWPMESDHGNHLMQGFQIPDVNSPVEWNLQPTSANQDVQAEWESMVIGVFDNDETMEERLFPAVRDGSAWGS